MNAMASQIAGVSIVCSTVRPGADQRKHQSSVALAFLREIHQVTGGFPSQRTSHADKLMTSFDDVIMQQVK